MSEQTPPEETPEATPEETGGTQAGPESNGNSGASESPGAPPEAPPEVESQPEAGSGQDQGAPVINDGASLEDVENPPGGIEAADPVGKMAEDVSPPEETAIPLNEVEEKILQLIQNWDMKAPEDEGYSEGRPHHAIKIFHAIAPILRGV